MKRRWIREGGGGEEMIREEEVVKVGCRLFHTYKVGIGSS